MAYNNTTYPKKTYTKPYTKPYKKSEIIKPAIKVLKTILILTNYNDYGWRTELNIVSINGGPKTYDMRDWKQNHSAFGNVKPFTLSGDEITSVFNALTIYKNLGEKLVAEEPEQEIKKAKAEVAETTAKLCKCHVCKSFIFDYKIHTWDIDFCSNQCASKYATQIGILSDEPVEIKQPDVVKQTEIIKASEFDFPKYEIPEYQYGMDSDDLDGSPGNINYMG